jgi:phosphopantetheine--protein transferase-like protein
MDYPCIKGIGIDMVYIPTIRKYIEQNSAFLRRTFTSKEQKASADRADPAQYYAARFAVKEAVFKAVAHLTENKTFDFRIVETLNTDDEAPYVTTDGALAPILQQAGITQLHISITTEGDYAAAFVVACGT